MGFSSLGILYYLSATVNPVLYNIMSKRYRNGFKRTLCRWTLPTPSTSYRNARSNGYHHGNNNLVGNHHYNSPLSPTLACSNNLRHQRLTYSNSNEKSRKLTNSLCHRRENILTFSMSKYKLVIGSRTLADHGMLPGQHSQRRTSFHCRFSVVERQELNEEQQQLQLQLQQRKFSMSVLQQSRKNRAKLLFRTALPAPATPPNSSISETKTLSQLPNGSHCKRLQH